MQFINIRNLGNKRSKPKIEVLQQAFILNIKFILSEIRYNVIRSLWWAKKLHFKNTSFVEGKYRRLPFSITYLFLAPNMHSPFILDTALLFVWSEIY